MNEENHESSQSISDESNSNANLDKSNKSNRLRGVGYSAFGGMLLFLASNENMFLFGLPPSLTRPIYAFAGVVAILVGIYTMITGRGLSS